MSGAHRGASATLATFLNSGTRLPLFRFRRRHTIISAEPNAAAANGKISVPDSFACNHRSDAVSLAQESAGPDHDLFAFGEAIGDFHIILGE
jgi:hypothetical protein